VHYRGRVSGAGGWERWEWDPSLFAGAAKYYEEGRFPYAPGLADALVSELGLDGHGRLLDVGCGPGSVARRVARLFDAVVGLDPDPGMLAEAARLAAVGGIRQAIWVRKRAEELPAGLGLFRVVTFGASFHWLDRPRVARAVRAMLTPDGAAVQVDAPGYRPDDLLAETGLGRLRYPEPPEEAIEELRRRYLGPDHRAGQGIRNTTPSGEDDVFQAAGFRPADIVVVPDGRELDVSIDKIVAGRFSASGGPPEPLGSEGLDALDLACDLRSGIEWARWCTDARTELSIGRSPALAARPSSGDLA
jgi:SAM-dependent methyltransferase